MLHSHTRLWSHVIWASKNRERILFKEPSKQLYNFLLKKSEKLHVHIEQLNIQSEHVHLLIDLPSNICLSDYMQNIKGSSSYWLNKNNIIKAKFSWQRGYGGYSVSASQLQKVKNYIKNQTKHHNRKSFAEEYDEWKKEYGIFDD
jgi:REP element-mobilizing transposase RayT